MRGARVEDGGSVGGMNADACTPPPWVVHCDGSAVPNPGRMGIGAVLMAPDGTRHAISRTSEARGCNNEAELMALTAALCELQRQGARTATLYCDNSVIVEQLAGSPVRPLARLASQFDAARRLMAGFEVVQLRWIPRHRNGEADALARGALGLAIKPAGPSVRRRR